MTFFREMGKCIEAGHLVSTNKYPELPASFVGQAPKTDAHFVNEQLPDTRTGTRCTSCNAQINERDVDND